MYIILIVETIIMYHTVSQNKKRVFKKVALFYLKGTVAVTSLLKIKKCVLYKYYAKKI